MAAVLELVFSGNLSTENLITWLSGHLTDKQSEPIPDCLKDLDIVRHEFIPFFLNYLRDQSLPLLQSSKTANPSPAKTPVNISTKPENPSSIMRPASRRSSSNRVQLFSDNPFESPTSFRDKSFDNKFISSPNSSADSSSVFDSGGTRRWRKPNTYSSPFEASPNDRSKQRSTLGDFLTTSTPDHDSWKKKPMQKNWKNDGSPSPRSGGRRSLKKPSPSAGLQRRLMIFPAPADSTNPPIFSLNNTDDFPPVGCDSPQQKRTFPTRRITPTCISHKVQPVSQNQQSSIMSSPAPQSEGHPAFQNVLQEKAFNLETERQLLRQEREKMKIAVLQNSRTSCGDSSQITDQLIMNTTPSKILTQRSTSITEYITADREEVTHEDQLDLLAQIHSGLLDGCLVSNITVELYFIIQLLTVQGPTDYDPASNISTDLIGSNYFISVHNAVFFAVSVLQRQSRLLCLLDKGTLRLLAENIRISSFTPSLRSTLSEAFSSSPVKLNTSLMSPIGGVSFQVDTDNKGNFPNERSFHEFKKQRDIFYELIREWQDKHLIPGWKMVDEFRQRIKSLVSVRLSLANHVHFVRLFQSQLIEMCKGDSGLYIDSEADNITLLSQLKKSNPEKFKRLQERFTTPYTVGGPSPTPGFTGCQEFFKDFITAAESHVFNQHLIDNMTIKIKEFNEVNIDLLDNETNGCVVDQEMRTLFSSCVATSRLLGKFLGFIIFLPYQTPESLPDSLKTTYLDQRSKMLARQGIDILQCLEEAVKSGRCILSVPWIVEYLSMMDPMAYSLDYFKAIVVLLIRIYKMAYHCYARMEHTLTMFLLIVLLGWFFEIPALPDGVFFMHEKIQMLPSPRSMTLDTVELISPQVLYTCCSYLNEIRSLLVEFAIGASSRNNQIRKITPISADQHTSVSFSDKNIQVQLEENLFHNHPASMKRCVDFIADRVASNYIKIFRNTTLPVLLRQAKQIGDTLAKNGDDDNRISDNMNKDDEAIAIAKKAKCDGIDAANGYTDERAATLLTMVLPEETSPSVLSVAKQICQRCAKEKVIVWMNTHMNQNMFRKEISAALEKSLKKKKANSSNNGILDDMPNDNLVQNMEPEITEEKSESEKSHNNSKPPVHVVVQMREFLKEFHESRGKNGIDRINKVLLDMMYTMNYRQDMVVVTYKTMASLTRWLAISIVTFCPNMLTEDILKILLDLWTNRLKPYMNARQFLCGNYMHMLNQFSPDVNISQRTLTKLILHLQRVDLLSVTDLCQSIHDIIKSPDISKDNIRYVGSLLYAVQTESSNVDPVIKETAELVIAKCPVGEISLVHCLNDLAGRNIDKIDISSSIHKESDCLDHLTQCLDSIHLLKSDNITCLENNNKELLDLNCDQ
ncbi:codanin-1-like [Tubulanus polymorphus]|uniref:codanin-1-like n=1 Tax=Tubulanus polymorphus TaxID=672921 RepID=UPI003DA6BF96